MTKYDEAARGQVNAGEIQHAGNIISVLGINARMGTVGRKTSKLCAAPVRLPASVIALPLIADCAEHVPGV